MMRNDVRHNARLAGAALLALAQLAVIACDKMPLTAPSGSTVTVRAGTEVLPLGGTTEISAFVSENGGTPVQNGTVVRFTTTMGRVDPVEAQTRNGLAVTTFLAGDVSGVTEVRATSGSAAGPATAPATGAVSTASGNTVAIIIGNAAIEQVLLRASPQFVPFTGGTVQLIATVIGVGSRVMPGVPVSFASTQGTLDAVQVVTDGNGEARTTLTTNREAQVTATAGTKTSAPVTISRREAPPVPAVTLTGTGAAAVVGIGQSWTFTATVTVSGGETNEARPVSYRWDFGDDVTVTTSGNSVTHVYTSPLVRRVVTVEVSFSNGQTASAAMEIIVAAF